MPQLKLRLLGTFDLVRGGAAASFRSEKERALLAYLALEAGRPHPREALAALLWPELPGDIALNNLRVTLHRLRQALGDPGATAPLLHVSRESIELRPGARLWVDVGTFEAALARVGRHPHETLAACPACLGALAAATALYRGEFLHGLSPAGSLPFSEWALIRRERLHRQALGALFQLAAHHQRRGELGPALTYAQRQLELEPWREEAHGQVMLILALSGERTAALRQFETCRAVLREEFGVEPSEETRAIHQRILAARSRPRINLPPPPTPFVGRRAELDQVTGLLARPDGRLITLLGPGGIGKSRLAAQAAEALAPAWLHGAAWVPLAEITDPAEVPRAIARAVALPLQPGGDPKAQVFDFLRERELLLVLDNFEMLLAPGAGSGAQLADQLLANAPDLRLLVTSRQRLGLQRERVVPLAGLSVPPEMEHLDLGGWEAAELFVQAARRTDPDFEPRRAGPAVARLCRLLEGVPLALELAAAWAGLLAPSQMVVEIERSLDFLANTWPDVPARQRSLRATFDYSYNLLAPEERRVLRSLAVFPGTFDLAAAEHVAGATLPVLRALGDRSLLAPADPGAAGAQPRYKMHELIRQFCREALEHEPAEQAAAYYRHGRYYLRWLNERNRDVMGGGDALRAGEAVRGEMDNVRLALERALAQSAVDGLAQSLNILMYHYELDGPFDEAERLFARISQCMQAAARAGQPAHPLHGRALMYHGWYCMRLGHYPEAEALTRAGLDLSLQAGELEGYGLALNSLGLLARQRGDYPVARHYLRQAIAVDAEIGSPWPLSSALANLGLVAVLQGDLAEASELFRQALDLAIPLNDPWSEAGMLEALGDVALRQGRPDLAEEHWRQCLAVRHKLGQRWRTADLLNKFAQVAIQRGQLARARRYCEASLAILQEFGERVRLAITLAQHGKVCLALGDQPAARNSVRSALALAYSVRVDSAAAAALAAWAALLAQAGQTHPAAEILAALRDHPALELADREQVHSLLAQIQAELSPQPPALPPPTSPNPTLDVLIEHVLAGQAAG